MNAWILVGEKSRSLKDIEKFIHRFKENGIDMQKVSAEDISLDNTNNPDTVFVNNTETLLPDLVISAYFGNIDEHNRCVSKMLEEKNTLSMNSEYCISICRNKLMAYSVIEKNGINANIPETLLFSPDYTKETIEKSFSYPLIVKINRGSKGDGVELVSSHKELISTARKLKEKYDDDIIIQQYISSSAGKDLRIILCGGKYITSFIRKNSHCFKSNLAEGGSIDFITPPPFLVSQAEKIGKALDINIGSVDFLIGENGVYHFCEANAMPGNSYSEAAKEKGIKDPFDDVIKNIINQIKTR